MNRRVAVELLGKMGVAVNAKESMDRISRRVLRVFEAKGEPQGMTQEEKELIAELTASRDAAAKKADAAPQQSKKTNGNSKASGKPKAKVGGGRNGKGCELFRSIFSAGKPVKRADVIDRLIKEGGVNPGTATSYVAWAKRPIKDKIKNPFGIRIVCAKDEQGTKWLKLAGK